MDLGHSEPTTILKFLPEGEVRATLRLDTTVLNVTWPPAASIPIILLQPALTLVRNVGWQLDSASRDRQDRVITATLKLAAQQQAAFVVLPEYALPASSIPAVDAAFTSFLPPNTILISGVEGLSLQKHGELVQTFGFITEPVQDAVWVNSSAMWVKDSVGQVQRFLQSKLYPSQPEIAAAGMFQGNIVRVFRTNCWSFAVLICYDLMGQTDTGETLSHWLTLQLKEEALRPIDCLFVIQCNDKPTHEAFLIAKEDLLRSQAVSAVFVANMAHPGCSGVYLPPDSFHAPPPHHPDTYYFGKLPGRLIQTATFRTADPTLFTFRYQRWQDVHKGGGRLPLLNARECAIDPKAGIATGLPIHPLHWAVQHYGPRYNPNKDEDPLTWPDVQAALSGNYADVQTALRASSIGRLSEQVDLLFLATPSPTSDPYQWLPAQSRTLGHMLRSLSILRFATDLAVDCDSSLVTATVQLTKFTAVAIVGGHPEYRIDRAIEAYVSTCDSRIPSDTLLLILDHRDNGPERPKARFVQTATGAMIDRSSRVAHLDVAVCDAHGQADGNLGRRVDRIPGTPVTVYSLKSLESLLADQDTTQNVARALLEVLG